MSQEADRADPMARTAARRAAYRAFVRANHPDVGGDPERFVAGLERFRFAHRGAARPQACMKRDDDSRYDGPIYVVQDGRGIGKLVVAVRHWRHRRGRAPRVR
jgi:hypothetical protein